MKYNIQGEPMPVVICHLEAGESMITERGSMVWMSANMRMETKSRRSRQGARPDVRRREPFPEHLYRRGRPRHDRLCLQLPGRDPCRGDHAEHAVIAQKSAFLAATPGVDLSIHFQKKSAPVSSAARGFIMQKLSGHGMAFLEIDGSAVEYTLAPGQQIIVDTGNLAMMDATCQIDIQTVRGAKNVLFGGEGLFNTVVTGPGRVVLQTMALPAFASALIPYLPAKSD